MSDMLRNNSVFCWKYLDERYLYSSGGVILPMMISVCERSKNFEY